MTTGDMFESEKQLRDDFNQNRLWLNEVLCQQIDAIFPKLTDASQKSVISRLSSGPISTEDQEKASLRLSHIVNEEIPRTRKRLEERFRALVGEV